MLTEQQLRSYLAWAGRKQPRRAASSTRGGPPRDEAYLEWIREMPCIGCGVECRSEAAHTGTDGRMSMKASDYSSVPLCSGCHTQAPGAYHRIGKRAFEREQRLSFVGIVARFNRAWQVRCARNGHRVKLVSLRPAMLAAEDTEFRFARKRGGTFTTAFPAQLVTKTLVR